MNVPANRRTSGFSLIEALVAVVVLSIGLLGVSALQISVQKNNYSALQRSQATMLAYFMMDAMRANKEAARLGSYDLGTLATNTPECTVPAGGSLIANDQHEWLQSLKDALGDLSTTCGLVNCTTTDCTVKVFWDDSRGAGGIANQRIEISSRL